METRSFEIRAVNQEAREVTGLAVPYNETVSIAGIYQERFAQGAISNDVTNVKLLWMHQEPIGLVTRGEDTPDGYLITARISQTPRGEEAYTLLKDGVINRFSVGFEPVADRQEDDGTIVRTKVNLREVSLVDFPAYDNAAVSEVRNANSTPSTEERSMPEENTEVTDLREAVTELERRMAVLGTAPTPSTPSLEFRSAGEFLKGLADGSARDKVSAYNRAYTGATTTDANVQPAWVADNIRLVVENRDFLNLWSKAPLPADGMSLEYLTLSGTSGTVAVQAAEGDDLGYMEVDLGNATATVKTYGGYTQVTRQTIERAGTPYLSQMFDFMGRQYAKATNAAVRTAFLAGSGYQTADLGGSDTAAAWLGTVIDATGLIHDNGYGSEAEFILMSKDVFKRVATLVDSANRPLLDIAGDGSNTIGSVNRNRKGVLFGLPVIVDSGLSASTCYVAASDAVKVWESAGAPFQLNDDNIINLSREFSLYGYMAVGIQNVKSVVTVDVTTP